MVSVHGKIIKTKCGFVKFGGIGGGNQEVMANN